MESALRKGLCLRILPWSFSTFPSGSLGEDDCLGGSSGTGIFLSLKPFPSFSVVPES